VGGEGGGGKFGEYRDVPWFGGEGSAPPSKNSCLYRYNVQFLLIYYAILLVFISRDLNIELQEAGYATIDHSFDIWHFIKVLN